MGGTRPAWRTGYGLTLLGVATWVVGCFLPYLDYTNAPGGLRISFYRMNVVSTGDGAIASVGGFLVLFGGAAIIAMFALAGLRGSLWSRPGLIGASTVWSVTWIGSSLHIFQLGGSREVGFWVLLLGIAIVVIGTIVALVERPAETRTPESVEALV